MSVTALSIFRNIGLGESHASAIQGVMPGGYMHMPHGYVGNPQWTHRAAQRRKGHFTMSTGGDGR